MRELIKLCFLYKDVNLLYVHWQFCFAYSDSIQKYLAMGLQNVSCHQATADIVAQVNIDNNEENKLDVPVDGVFAGNNATVSQHRPVEIPEEDLHRGVQDIEAMTQTWSKTALIAVFVKYVFLLLIGHHRGIYLTISTQYLVSLLHECVPKRNPLQLDSIPYQ